MRVMVVSVMFAESLEDLLGVAESLPRLLHHRLEVTLNFAI